MVVTDVVPGRSPEAPSAPRRKEGSWFGALLVGYALLILAFFTADELGLFAPLRWGSQFRNGLIAMAVIGVSSTLWLRRTYRTQLSLTAILALVVSVPINKIEGVSKSDLYLIIGVLVVVAAVGYSASRSRFSRRTLILLTVFMGVNAISTALSGSGSGFLKFTLMLVPALSAFLLTGRLDHIGRRNVSIAIVALAVAEALIAIPEPFRYPHKLWAFAAVEGIETPSNNVIAGLTRAQATMGHPLPLGLLAMIGLALLLRVVEPRAFIKWPLALILVAAVFMAGSRNSLILAAILFLFYPGRKLTSARLMWAGIVGAVGVIVGLLTNQLNFSAVDTLVNSGSYSHRAAALDAFVQLLSRQDFTHTMIGNGFGGIPALFRAGLLQTDGFEVVDNQFVAQLGQAGLVGMIALLVFTARPLVARDWHWRGATLVILANCMIYDWLSWPSSAALALFVLGSAYAHSDTRRRPAPLVWRPPVQRRAPLRRITSGRHQNAST